MDIDKHKDMMAEGLEERIMQGLVRNALYAISSNSRDDVNECYGAAKMAYLLGGINKESMQKLNHVLVSGWMNAGDRQREAYARTVTAEDIRAGRNWRDK